MEAECSEQKIEHVVVTREEVNRIFRLSNQSNSIESNRTIEIRLPNTIEYQSNFYIFFWIGSIAFDWYSIAFD